MDYLNRTSVAKVVTESLGASVRAFGLISGLVPVGSYIPSTKGEYDQYRRLLHDVVCHAMVDSLHFNTLELRANKLGLHTNNKKLNQQKPDLYTLEGDQLSVGEVAVTYSPERDRLAKETKYLELFKFIKTGGFSVSSYNVIILDLTSAEWEDNIPRISDLFSRIINDMIDNLRFMHTDPILNYFRKQEAGLYQTDRFNFTVEDEFLCNQVEEATGVSISASEIKSRIELGSKEGLDDKQYISAIASGILSSPLQERPRPHPEPMTPKILLTDWEKYKSIRKNTEKIPRILQLGSPSQIIELSKTLNFSTLVKTLKSTNHFGGYLDLIKSSLEFEDPDEDHIIHLPLSQEQLEKEQMQGPGRKSIIKRLGLKIDRTAPTHIGVSDEHTELFETFCDDIEELTRDSTLQEESFPGIEAMGVSAYTSLSNALELVKSCPMAPILKFYQRISNEIVINSMRRRKTRQYVLCSSGVEDVYFLVAPGPQLRTESNTEFIKIISFVSPLCNKLSAPYNPVGDHWESDWLSVDTDRLKHWQRAFDRVVLSFISNCERLVEPDTSLAKAMQTELKFRNFHFIASVYLEDKQLTSVTNQTIRYLWMKSIGDKCFKSLISKFPTRVNSVLQSIMLQRSVNACVTICQTNLSDLVKLGKSVRDSETGNYDETTTGIVGKLPRLITKGEMVPVSYNLNEIYYCMAYNKDRQNQAQDALSILTKIEKEEDKYNKELASRKTDNDKVSYFLGNTTTKQDMNHINSLKPESHFYSARAVMVAAGLQDHHSENMGDSGSWKNPERIEAILGKNLSEFATFKASVKQICRKINLADLREIDKIGVRTKAVELVAELVSNEQLMTAAEVAMSYSGKGSLTFEIFIQIFKKGQIGGVREIIILYIKARIVINILEELARLMAKSDKREILTKGRDKRLMMRGDYEEVMSKFTKGTPVKMIKESFDMTTWAQKFIPAIFMTLFEYHFKDITGIRDLSRMIFLAHCNKKLEYPKMLVKQWMLHPEICHDSKPVQDAKNKFLTDGVPYFVNHSNMCQGIPHYNSTILGLYCVSLRDGLFKECLRQLGQDCHIQWKTRLGSDDKGNMIGIDMSRPNSYNQYVLFGQCEHAAERLLSMELSVKSASGHIMYELNSAFMSNLETLSPTIKFAMAAVDVIGTTSCSNFVNESYSRIRQLRENGSSSIVCGLAHILNKTHFEMIFSTSKGDTNSPHDIFKLPERQIPYDLGVYPFYDIDLQDVTGPEYHNYTILKSSRDDNIALKLLYTELSKTESTEIFPSEESELLKKDHFGIHQGIVRQLSNMRRRLNITAEPVEEFFVRNPFLIVRGPETIEETKMAIYAKLFTRGASESLRRTSPAIYIGRLSAFKTAKAWSSTRMTDIKVFNLENGEESFLLEECKMTYKDFLTEGCKKASSRMDLSILRESKNLLFPQWQSYDVIEQFIGKFGVVRTSKKRYSQAVRNWAANTFNYEYSASLKSIIETSFGLSQLAAKEDVMEFKKLLGMNLENLENFIDECTERHIRPLDMFFYMQRLHKLSKSSRIQTFAYGPSTSSMHLTAISIKRYNHSAGQLMMIDEGLHQEDLLEENSLSGKLDTLKFYCNLKIMSINGSLEGVSVNIPEISIDGIDLESTCETIVRSIKSLSGFDYTTQKIIKFATSQLLTAEEFKQRLLSWKSFNYHYLQRQKKTITNTGKVQWSGNLGLLVTSGNEVFTLNERDNVRYLRSSRTLDIDILLRSLKEICKIIDFDFRSFFKLKVAKVGDIYLSDSTKCLHRADIAGNKLNILDLRISDNFPYKRLQDFDNFTVKTTHNERSQEIQVFLQDHEMRSVTVCHFSGIYYPVTIPGRVFVEDKVKYLGVSLGKLFLNKDWFFNGRLPAFTDVGVVEFLKNCVDIQTVLSLEGRDMTRIKNYIETKEEVYEDHFATNLAEDRSELGLLPQKTLDELKDASSFNDIFRDEINKMTEDQTFTTAHLDDGGKFSWADEVEAEEEFQAGLLGVNEIDFNKEDDGVGIIRAFGYKKPMARRNMAAISTLQQGGYLKKRVVNLVFKNDSVEYESVRQLPYKYLWLRSVEGDEKYGDLIKCAKEEIIHRLSQSIGNSERVIRGNLDSKELEMLIPLPRLQSLLNENSKVPLDLFDQLVSETYDDAERYNIYEESDADSNV
jgi:hypothetical protein